METSDEIHRRNLGENYDVPGILTAGEESTAESAIFGNEESDTNEQTYDVKVTPKGIKLRRFPFPLKKFNRLHFAERSGTQSDPDVPTQCGGIRNESTFTCAQIEMPIPTPTPPTTTPDNILDTEQENADFASQIYDQLQINDNTVGANTQNSQSSEENNEPAPNHQSPAQSLLAPPLAQSPAQSHLSPPVEQSPAESQLPPHVEQPSHSSQSPTDSQIQQSESPVHDHQSSSSAVQSASTSAPQLQPSSNIIEESDKQKHSTNGQQQKEKKRCAVVLDPVESMAKKYAIRHNINQEKVVNHWQKVNVQQSEFFRFTGDRNKQKPYCFPESEAREPPNPDNKGWQFKEVYFIIMPDEKRIMKKNVRFTWHPLSPPLEPDSLGTKIIIATPADYVRTDSEGFVKGTIVDRRFDEIDCCWYYVIKIPGSDEFKFMEVPESRVSFKWPNPRKPHADILLAKGLSETIAAKWARGMIAKFDDDSRLMIALNNVQDASLICWQIDEYGCLLFPDRNRVLILYYENLAKFDEEQKMLLKLGRFPTDRFAEDMDPERRGDTIDGLLQKPSALQKCAMKRLNTEVEFYGGVENLSSERRIMYDNLHSTFPNEQTTVATDGPTISADGPSGSADGPSGSADGPSGSADGPSGSAAEHGPIETDVAPTDSTANETNNDLNNDDMARVIDRLAPNVDQADMNPLLFTPSNTPISANVTNEPNFGDNSIVMQNAANIQMGLEDNNNCSVHVQAHEPTATALAELLNMELPTFINALKRALTTEPLSSQNTKNALERLVVEVQNLNYRLETLNRRIINTETFKQRKENEEAEIAITLSNSIAAVQSNLQNLKAKAKEYVKFTDLEKMQEKLTKSIMEQMYTFLEETFFEFLMQGGIAKRKWTEDGEDTKGFESHVRDYKDIDLKTIHTINPENRTEFTKRARFVKAIRRRAINGDSAEAMDTTDGPGPSTKEPERINVERINVERINVESAVTTASASGTVGTSIPGTPPVPATPDPQPGPSNRLPSFRSLTGETGANINWSSLSDAEKRSSLVRKINRMGQSNIAQLMSLDLDTLYAVHAACYPNDGFDRPGPVVRATGEPASPVLLGTPVHQPPPTRPAPAPATRPAPAPANRPAAAPTPATPPETPPRPERPATINLLSPIPHTHERSPTPEPQPLTNSQLVREMFDESATGLNGEVDDNEEEEQEERHNDPDFDNMDPETFINYRFPPRDETLSRRLDEAINSVRSELRRRLHREEEALPPSQDTTQSIDLFTNSQMTNMPPGHSLRSTGNAPTPRVNMDPVVQLRAGDRITWNGSPLPPSQDAQVDAETAAGVDSLTDDSDSLRSTPIRGRIKILVKKKKKYEKTVNDLMAGIERLQNVPGVEAPKQVLETRKQRAIKILHNTNTELSNMTRMESELPRETHESDSRNEPGTSRDHQPTSNVQSTSTNVTSNAANPVETNVQSFSPTVQASTSTPAQPSSSIRRRRQANTELANDPKRIRLSVSDQPGTSGTTGQTGPRRKSTAPKVTIPPILDDRSDSGLERPIEEDNVNLPLSDINMTPSMRLVNRALIISEYSICTGDGRANKEQLPEGHPLRVANYAANFGWRLSSPYINGRQSMADKLRGTLNRITVDDRNPRMYESIFQNAYFRGVYQWMLFKFPYELTPDNNRAFMGRVKSKLKNNIAAGICKQKKKAQENALLNN